MVISGGLEARSTDADVDDLPLSTTEILNLSTGHWRSSADFPFPLSSPGVAVGPVARSGETFVVTGGQINAGVEDEWSSGICLFESQQPWVWKYLEEEMRLDRSHHSAFLLKASDLVVCN